MRLPIILSVAVLIAGPAFSQTPGQGFARMSMSGHSDAKTASFTFTPQPGQTRVSAVTGAPFSGTQVNESLQTLPDGMHITHPNPRGVRMYRDSLGRTRAERPTLSLHEKQLTLPEISDPVAGYFYVLDSDNKVAHRVPLKVTPAGPGRSGHGPGQTYTASDGRIVTVGSLGTQVMSGVSVVGVKQTTVHPAGSLMGNDGPVTTTGEVWTSPQLGLTMYSKASNPGGQDSRMEWKDFSAGEPDPSLFLVPAGYQIVDETGSFSVTITLPN